MVENKCTGMTAYERLYQEAKNSVPRKNSGALNQYISSEYLLFKQKVHVVYMKLLEENGLL